MKTFTEQYNEIIREDLSPKDIDKLDDNMKRMVVLYDNSKKKEWQEEGMYTKKEIQDMIKDYKWDGKVFVNKKDSNKYIGVIVP